MGAAKANKTQDIPLVPYEIFESAQNGDVEAMRDIEQIFEPYLCKRATVTLGGNRTFNVDLYDRLKKRLMLLVIYKF